MKYWMLAAATAVAVLAAPSPASAASDAFIGEITLFSGRYCPVDWVDADGRVMPIRGNEALYSILGDSFGGDGRTNFALPDLRKSVPAAVADAGKQLRYCIAVRGYYPMRPS